ncbi:IpaD/SipD/SspD family type III secretion system needle tip protein [Erwinia tasmaniensis]|nr:IpaD/SipD/SspD family type III secretion system needle tip protein [Erwinia tasmaniensis]
MAKILVVPSQNGEDFAQVYVADKQTAPLLESERVLDIEISQQILDALSGIEFDYKFRGLKNTLDGFVSESIEPHSKNVENLAKKLGDLSAELYSQDAPCSVARQKELADDILSILSGLNSERRNVSVKTEFSHHQSKRSLEDLKELQAVSHEGRITIGTSYADLWAKISLAICRIKSEYIDFYAGLMKKYLDMYQSYNKDVQKASSESLSAGEDGNSVNFDKKIMSDGYNKFNIFLSTTDLGNVKGWENMSGEERLNMRTTLDPAFEIAEDGAISFNMAQYSSIKGEFPNGKNGQVPVATYNSWLVRFNAVGSALQSNMQSFSSRYSQASSTYDTLNKVFSETINRMGNNALDFLKQ